MTHNNLEVCCSDPYSLRSAREGGATRIELCEGLTEGGLTPSPSLLAYAVSLGFEEINVLIRCRKGDFLYDTAEKALMLYDAAYAIENGATGIVWGALTPEGEIDTEALAMMRKVAEGRDFTFHRAFDVCADPRKALEQIIEAGCTCLLTSGLASNASKGIDMIRSVNIQAAGRIDIMAGSGVNASNARDIIDKTGIHLVHATSRRPVASGMKFRREGVPMGAPGEDEFSIMETSPEEVKAILTAINQ